MPNVKTSQSRVFTIEDRAGPANVPVYQGRARALSPSWDLGDLTPVREPDPNRYGAFKIVDSIKGEKGLPTLSIQARYQFTVSAFLEMARRGCPIDIQIHLGRCQDPRDFNLGWDKILVLEGADLSSWSAEDLGALEQGQNAVVHEQIDTSALDMYEIIPMVMRELGGEVGGAVHGEVLDVAICDSVTCGICGIPSTGCLHVFALTIGHADSPGLPSEIIFSIDGGATLLETSIATLPLNFDGTAMACAGPRLVVVSNADCAIHYALIADILNEDEIWTRTAAGLVCPGGAPNDLFSLGSSHIWIVGNTGHIYFSDDITAGVTVQDAGVVTGQNLNAIHGYDENSLIAVGVANALVLTRDGGQNWALIVPPDTVGVILNTCWMRTEDEWFIGDANGQLWYTRDGGDNWEEKTFPGSGTGMVRDIVFATPTVGYMAHSIVGPAGRILRTIDGGNSWYILPETTGAMPANDYVAALAAVAECPSVVYGGGLAAAGAGDGFFVKGGG